MAGHRFHKAARLYNTVFTVSLLTVMLLIMLLSYSTFQNLASDMIRQNQQIMLNRVQYLQESLGSVLSGTANRAVTLMYLTRDTSADPHRLQQELDRLADTGSGVPRIWLRQRDGQIIRSTGTSLEYLEQHDWWKSYAEEKWPGPVSILGMGESYTGIIFAHPFRGAMGLSTVLPAVVFLSGSESDPSLMFVEFDLTMILSSRLRDFSLNLYETAWPLEIQIFDRDGMLLETTINLPLQTKELLDGAPGLGDRNISYEDSRFRTGSIFRRENGQVAVYARHSTLGLIFCGQLPAHILTDGAKKAASYVLFIGFICLIIVLVLSLLSINFFSRMKYYEQAQAQARFEALQAQMNPHFLFNTLDSLVGVAEQKNYPSLIEMIRSISYILHINLRKSGESLLLSEELRYIKSYVQLQEIRYRNLFVFTTTTSALDTEDTVILKYCIQPLVENSFIHGVHLREKIIRILLSVSQTDDRLVIQVEDDGPGCPESTRDQLLRHLGKGAAPDVGEAPGHLGILSIHRRVVMLYGPEYGIRLPPTETGFRVRLELPLRHPTDEVRLISHRFSHGQSRGVKPHPSNFSGISIPKIR